MRAVRRSILPLLGKIDLHRFLSSTLFGNTTARTKFGMLQPLRRSILTLIDTHRAAFLVGDAHRTVEPFSGEGVFFALQDGVSIAVKLLALIQRPSSVRLNDRLVVIGKQSPLLVSLAAKPVLDRIEVSQ